MENSAQLQRKDPPGQSPSSSLVQEPCGNASKASRALHLRRGLGVGSPSLTLGGCPSVGYVGLLWVASVQTQPCLSLPSRTDSLQLQSPFSKL